MTSLERAKRFIAQKGQAIAMTIVPLAGLAMAPSTALATVPPGFSNNGNCTVSATNGNVAGGGCLMISDGTNPDNGFLGAKMYGNNSSEPFATSNTGSGGLFGLDISTGFQSANVSGFTGAIPVSWNFSATNTDQQALTYLLTFTLYGATPQQLPNDSQIAPQTLAILTESTTSGTDNFNLFSFQTVTGYSMDLRVTENGQGTITVNIPSNSIDINESTSAVPEPATFLMLGTGLAGLVLGRFRRKR